ncbi:hypothetical protein Vafri_8207, partial [Volvox africanus]
AKAADAAAAVAGPSFSADAFTVVAESGPVTPADPEAAIRQLLSQIQIQTHAGTSVPLGLDGVSPQPSSSSPSPSPSWTGAGHEQSQRTAGVTGVRNRRLQELEPGRGEEDWVRSMAALYAAGGETSRQAADGASNASVESYTDETSAALESASAASDPGGADLAPSAPPSQGRRTLFGEPLQLLIPEGVTVRGLAALLGVPPARLESFLRDQLGEEVRSDREEVAPESAELAALEFGRIGIVRRDAERAGSSAPEPRQPVVTILGHVDHGKTSLLDALRSTSVAAGEAGGITQHIGAFEVKLAATAGESSPPSAITFVDTPGHEAFSAMRARGAAVTDVAVLVVAADEGVKPQTREALAHARSAGCPVVVAITKCDKPTARPDFVKAQLAAEGLDLEDFGGTVQVVHTSANTGEGLRELEEALLLQAELMDLHAPRGGPASGSVIEARLERGLGPVATVIIKRGTLQVGDPVVVGTEFGRVRALRTEATAAAGGAGGGGDVSSTTAAQQQKGVRPGQYALVSGLEGLPQAGDQLLVVPNAARARVLAEARRLRAEEFRRMQLAAALHAQRQREAQQHAEEYQRRRALKAERMRLLGERKRLTAEKLRERAAQLRAEEEAASAAAASAMPGAHRGEAATSAAVGDAVSSAAVAAVREAESDGGARADADADVDAAAPPVATLNLVVKADVQGSVEAVMALVESLASEQRAAAAAAGGHVAIKIVHSGVGPLSPSDLNLAVAAGAHVVMFNVALGPETESAFRAAQAGGVRVLSQSVVYHLMDALREEVRRAAAEGAAAAVGPAGDGSSGAAALTEVGQAEVVATFQLTSAKSVKDGRIAGVRVVSGEVTHGGEEVWRVVRSGQVVWEGRCTSLRQHRAAVRAVEAGLECGVVLEAGQFSAFEIGDQLICLRRGRRPGVGASGGR